MSQRNVEQLLGRLVSDEAFRRHWWHDPAATLAELVASGSDFNPCERRALLTLGRDELERFAASLDPCIQKSDLKGGRG